MLKNKATRIVLIVLVAIVVLPIVAFVIHDAMNKSLPGALSATDGDLIEALKHVGRGDVTLNENDQVTTLDIGMAWPSRSKITDEDLKRIATLSSLEVLVLQRSAVTDDGLIHLKPLTKLRTLYLNETEITDAGLQHLKEMNALESLSLSGTKVTDDGVDAFIKACPECRVHRY